MKVWYKTTGTLPPVSIGKSSGEADEDYIEGDIQEVDHEFYENIDPSAPAILRKSQSAIDAIKAQRAINEAQEAIKKEARRQRIISRLSGLSNTQIDTYVDDNVTSLAGAVAYLKRLTKVVRDLAVNVGGG